MEEEGEENPWVIQPEQKDYYTKQFQKLQPMEDGVVKGEINVLYCFVVFCTTEIKYAIMY